MDTVSDLGRRSTGGLINRNVTAHGHRTSMRLELEFWDAFEEVCRREKIGPAELILRAQEGRRGGSRTGAVRAYLLTYFRAGGWTADAGPPVATAYSHPDGPPNR